MRPGRVGCDKADGGSPFGDGALLAFLWFRRAERQIPYVRFAIAIVLCAAACGRPSRTCGAEDYIYVDRSCNLQPPGDHLGCRDVGDGLCYLRCGSDRDCPEAVPYCRTLGLYSGGDFNCNGSVRICREADRSDCPVTAGGR